jgi:hypothetical protein
MRKFSDLTEQEQAAAENKAAEELLRAILDGAVRFNDKLNGDRLQARIDKAVTRADKMQTPWFAHEYIMDTCAEEIRGMARCNAEDALYLDPGENAVRL